MYSNVAYLYNSLSVMVDTSHPLTVTSCGYFRLQTDYVHKTDRPHGRKDYQLIYIAKGKAHFYFNGKKHVISAGNIVLYRPDEPQHYHYHSTDKTEVYWVHFTGCEVEAMINRYLLSDTENIFYAGNYPDYPSLFNQMIRELQLCHKGYEELLTLFLRQVFVLLNRYANENKKTGSDIQNEIELATHYFNEQYHTPISIADYAHSRHMSTCWFIRNFKKLQKVTPCQYILALRIANAKNLLENTNYSICEIAETLGFDNPLYFSRLFHKHTGTSPSAYRKSKAEGNML